MRSFLLSIVMAAACLASPMAPVPARAETSCWFQFGFKALHDLIPSTVGDCREIEHSNLENGNAEQNTSGGLLVWRKADNWTAFTDGTTTWINGPAGLVRRPNAGPLFSWEAPVTSVVAAPGPASATPQPPRAASPPMPPNTALEFRDNPTVDLATGGQFFSGQIVNHAAWWIASDIRIVGRMRDDNGVVVREIPATVLEPTALRPGDRTTWQFNSSGGKLIPPDKSRSYVFGFSFQWTRTAPE